METSQLDRWISVSANIAVLLGIFFLVLEIQQSNRIATAATEVEVRDQFRDLNRAVLENPEVAELLVKAYSADAQFSDIEEERAYAYVFAFMNTWASIEHAYDNGMVSKRTMEIAVGDIKGLARDYPGFRPILQGMLESTIGMEEGSIVKTTLEEVINETRGKPAPE